MVLWCVSFLVIYLLPSVPSADPPFLPCPALPCPAIALIWASGLWITSRITDWEAAHSISLPSLCPLALLPSLSLYRSTTFTHPPHPHTEIAQSLTLFLFSFPSCHLISRTTSLYPPPPTYQHGSFRHVLSCHSSFSSFSPNTPLPPHLPISLTLHLLQSPHLPCVSTPLPSSPLTFSLRPFHPPFLQHDNHRNNDAEAESCFSRMINLL